MNSDEPTVKRMRSDNRLFLKEKLSPCERIPLEVVEKIFSHLKYEKIAELRLVCRKFNAAGKMLLHKGRLKVENELAERLESMRSELLDFDCGEYNMKYDFLYFVDSSLDKLCKLFREFMGENVECFTLGKFIDLLKVIFVSLDYIRHNLDDDWYYEVSTARRFYRRSYDIQMKHISEFDYIFAMWAEFEDYCAARIRSPSDRLLYPYFVDEDKDARRMKEIVDKQIIAERDSYISFTSFESRNEYWTFYEFPTLNEYWTFYEPPPLNEKHMEMFRKYLL